MSWEIVNPLINDFKNNFFLAQVSQTSLENKGGMLENAAKNIQLFLSQQAVFSFMIY